MSYKTYEIVKPNFPEKTNYIPHAFPKEIYYPLSKEKREAARAQHFGVKKDWFIGLWVNRNASRKMPSDVLEAWKMFLDTLQEKEGHKNATLIMHTDPNDSEGPNLFTVAEMLGISGNVWFSPNRVNFEEMNIIHNISDVCVNIAKNEGFGLSTMISMQCGQPIIALKTGGVTRQVVDHRDNSENGIAIEPVTRKLVGSQMVPYIYEDFAQQKDVAEAFYKIYKMSPEEKETLSQKLKDYVDFEYNYSNVVSEWDKTLNECIVNFKAQPEKRWELLPIDPVVSHQPKTEIRHTPALPIQGTVPKITLPTRKPIDISAMIKARTEGKR